MGQKNPLTPAAIDLLYQALETEHGGIKIYETALTCAQDKALHHEWETYLKETRHHEQVLLNLFQALGLEPTYRSPGREVVAGIGHALVTAMEQAKANATPEQAELVACEAVVLAETKDHANWELLGKIAENTPGGVGKAIQAAVDEVEDEEDHHLYHTKGWCRELWIQALGYPAVLPPPEEVKQVETAIGAARAEQARDELM